MRKLILRLTILIRDLVSGWSSPGSAHPLGGGPAPGGVNRQAPSEWVSGHRRRDGTYVRPHRRRPRR